MLTPDFDFCATDLNEQAHRFLPRRSPFPEAQADYVYAFDPLSQADVNRYKRQALAWRALLGEGDDVQGEEFVWVISDVRGDKFGEVVPEEVLEGDNFSELGGKGVVVWDDVSRFCEQLARPDVEAQLKKWRAADGDCRLFPVQ